MLKVEDKLVVALAKERLFLCEWIETNFRPQPTEKERKRGDIPEVPEQALRILRLAFKSLSNKVKHKVMKDEEANVLIKVCYAEHLDWATTWAHIQSDSRASFSAALAPVHNRGNPSGDRSSIPSGGKGGGQKRQSETGSAPAAAKQSKFDDTAPSWVRLNIGSKHVHIEKDCEKMVWEAAKKPAPNNTAEMFKSYRKSTLAIFAIACRNCFSAGRGLQEHSLADCKKAGHPCAMLCTTSRKGVHWTWDCTE